VDDDAGEWVAALLDRDRRLVEVVLLDHPARPTARTRGAWETDVTLISSNSRCCTGPSITLALPRCCTSSSNRRLTKSYARSSRPSTRTGRRPVSGLPGARFVHCEPDALRDDDFAGVACSADTLLERHAKRCSATCGGGESGFH
jgi:hypothetical protein